MRVGRWTIERRSTYTQDIADELLRQATGVPGNREGLAAVQAAAGLWSRSLAAAEPSSQGEVLTPSVLSRIGRQLLLKGESAFVIDVLGSRRITLTPCVVDAVEGDFDERTWRYRCVYEVPTSSGSREMVRKVSGEQVLHCRLDADPPWKGRSPLASAGLSSDLAAALEQLLGREMASNATGYLLPLARGPAEAGMDTLRSDLGSLKGRLRTVETQFSGAGGGLSRRPQHDWKQVRIGADPPPVLAEMRRDLAEALLGAAGVPVDLVGASTATGRREAYRQFVTSTIEPVARLLEQELAAKLPQPVTLGFTKLAAADVASKARAWRQLVGKEAVMTAAEAAEKVGFV